ncbi:MAG TPA: Trp biosynthesis-associated membrane protein [Frankiaceae bacterium]|jgi:hypothetical protein|nr:Trp biosynthesis-associated membrane protein [Frankiaceae bacterium]
MTAGPDPTQREAGIPAGRERGFGGHLDPDEPRFAGPPTAGTRPAPPWSTEATEATYASAPYERAPYQQAPYQQTPVGQGPPGAFPPPAAPAITPPPNGTPGLFPPADGQPGEFDMEPVVDYGNGVQLAVEPSDGLALSRIGCAVGAAGGLLAGIGSFLTWATLRLTANGTDSQGFTADPSSITYNGLSLLEGRIMLVLGLLSIALSAALLPRRAPRLLGPALAVTGGLGVVVMAFAAIGHPVELATLFRSYRQIDAVKVSLPNGAGAWLAVIGALLILAGGLLALMRRSEMQGEGRE